MELIDKSQYLSGKKASEILGIHQRTLHLWDKNKKSWYVKGNDIDIDKYIYNSFLIIN